MRTGFASPYFLHKIAELEQALFIPESKALIAIQTQVIEKVYFDPYGDLWFVVNRRVQDMSGFDRQFPAKLGFLKKGRGLFIEVTGKVIITNDPEDLNHISWIPSGIIRAVRQEELILLSVSIEHAEVHELNVSNPFRRIWNALVVSNDWIFIRFREWKIWLKNRVIRNGLDILSH